MDIAYVRRIKKLKTVPVRISYIIEIEAQVQLYFLFSFLFFLIYIECNSYDYIKCKRNFNAKINKRKRILKYYLISNR